MEKKRTAQIRNGVRQLFTPREQGKCRSSGKVLNLKIVLDWFSGAISPMAKCWTTKTDHARRGRRRAKISGVREGVAPEGTPQRLCPHSPVLKERRLTDDEVERDVGELHALGFQP